MKFKLVVASALAILAFSLPVFMVHALPSGITVDGDPSDWTALGLSTIGTDPPYNIKSYHDISSDLLEVWACMDSSCLYLMMKVRGGDSYDFRQVAYEVWMNVDPNAGTGSVGKWDYAAILGSRSYTYLFNWNETTLSFSAVNNGNYSGKAGGLGYIEWGIPMTIIGNVSSVELMFFTWDSYLDETVNKIQVTVTPTMVIPEFFSTIVLVLPLTIAASAVALLKKRTRHA